MIRLKSRPSRDKLVVLIPGYKVTEKSGQTAFADFLLSFEISTCVLDFKNWGEIEFGLNGGQLKLETKNCELLIDKDDPFLTQIPEVKETIEYYQNLAVSIRRPCIDIGKKKAIQKTIPFIHRKTGAPCWIFSRLDELEYRLNMHQHRFGRLEMTQGTGAIGGVFTIYSKNLEVVEFKNKWRQLNYFSPKKKACKLVLAELFEKVPGGSGEYFVLKEEVPFDIRKQKVKTQTEMPMTTAFVTGADDLFTKFERIHRTEEANFLRLISDIGFDPSKDLVGADLRGLNLKNAEFKNADLRYADFSGADLSNASFSAVNLENAEFAGSILENVTFDSTRVYGCNFSFARFRGVDLEYFRNNGVILDGATVADAEGMPERTREFLKSENARVENMLNVHMIGKNEEKVNRLYSLLSLTQKEYYQAEESIFDFFMHTDETPLSGYLEERAPQPPHWPASVLAVVDMTNLLDSMQKLKLEIGSAQRRGVKNFAVFADNPYSTADKEAVVKLAADVRKLISGEKYELAVAMGSIDDMMPGRAYGQSTEAFRGLLRSMEDNAAKLYPSVRNLKAYPFFK